MRMAMRVLGALPLPALHAVGVFVGWGVYVGSARFRKYLRENLAQAGFRDGAMVRAAVAEAGKGFTELPVAWFRDIAAVLALVRECRGWEHIEAARASGRGLILLTPHLGCWEIGGRYVTARMPISWFYSPPKQLWLEPILMAGRQRGFATMLRADLGGVRAALKSLRAGGAVAILPDQVPGKGEGAWADFFGRPAYTMTLAGRLAQATGASVVAFFGERLQRGRGYRVWIEPLATKFNGEREHDARVINAAVESLIRIAPAQYLWSYNRYKVPSGAEPPAVPKGGG